MIVLAILFAALGTADVIRSLPRGNAWSFVAGGAVVLALGLTSNAGWWLLLDAAVVAGWLVLTRESASRREGYWALALLGAAALSIVAVGGLLPVTGGPLAQWYEQLPFAGLSGISVTTFALAAGSVLLLIGTANVIVRIALTRMKTDDPPESDAVERTRFGWRRKPVVVPPAAVLRGGRLIGPLERVFLFALAMAGQFVAIGAIVAAKGIIRFPEISKDDAGGSKAEYFLIGSLTSWATVLVAVVLVRLA